MIGVIIVGGLAAMGIASMARRHHRWHHGYGWGGHPHGWGHHHGLPGWSHGHGGFGGRCGHGGWGANHEPGEGFEGGEGEGPGMWLGGPGPGFNPMRLRRGRRWLMKALFRRLETTPTQQEALRAATEEFQQSAKALKGEAGRTRSEVAAALRRPAIDAEALGELFARHDTAIDSLRKAFVGMTIRVHEVLDEEQRNRLARLIETGPRGLRGEMPGGW